MKLLPLLPGVRDDVRVGDVADAQQHVAQAPPRAHGLQHTADVAQGQAALDGGTPWHQPHRAGHQRDLPRDKHSPSHLGTGEKTPVITKYVFCVMQEQILLSLLTLS